MTQHHKTVNNMNQTCYPTKRGLTTYHLCDLCCNMMTIYEPYKMETYCYHDHMIVISLCHYQSGALTKQGIGNSGVHQLCIIERSTTDWRNYYKAYHIFYSTHLIAVFNMESGVCVDIFCGATQQNHAQYMMICWRNSPYTEIGLWTQSNQDVDDCTV